MKQSIAIFFAPSYNFFHYLDRKEKLLFAWRLFFIIAYMAMPTTGYNQPVIEWERNFGGSSSDRQPIIAPAPDGGFVIAGISQSSDQDILANDGRDGREDYWVIRIDNQGNLIWERNYGGSLNEYAKGIVSAPDGGFVIAGESASSDGDVSENKGIYDYWVVKVDEDGDLVWEQNYGGLLSDREPTIISTADGGFILVGYSASRDGDVSGNNGTDDYWIVKIDGQGNIIWERNYGGSNQDWAKSAVVSPDGGYVLAGWSRSNNGDVSGNNGGIDYWLVKIDEQGNIVWERSYGGSAHEYASAITTTSDGGYVVVGRSASSNGDVSNNNGYDDFWIIKVDGAGNLVWEKNYGGELDDWPESVQATSDGGYLIAGWSSSISGDISNSHGGYDFWLIKIDDQGNLLWEQTHGGSSDDYAKAIISTSDGGFVVSGTSASSNGDVSDNHGGEDYWIVKFSEISSLDCDNFTDITSGAAEQLSAATCLCELGYVEPKNYGGANTNGVEPDEFLYRADLAKLLYYMLYKNGDVTNNPALNFPTPFYDLEAQIFQDQQNSGDPSYYNYGKILSYLEYGDGVTPFDRKFLNFNPYQTIQRRYALKALLETLNIAPDESGPSPFPEEINPGDDAYGYVKKAVDMDLITVGNVTTPVLRGDFFVILHRLIQSLGDGSCTLNYTTPEVLETAYFVPGNLRPEGLSRAVGLSEGYFTHAEKPVFNIPGFNMPLQFQIFYNSYLTELPENARRLAPLGIGWSHNFNAYMVEESSLDESGAAAADKLFVFWPGGAIHQYDRPAPNAPGPQRCESVGVFDQIEPITGGFRITKKNQVKYIFTEYSVSEGNEAQRIWMLTEIIDRNQNAIVLAVEDGVNDIPRIASVTGTSGSRRLLFTYKNGTNQLVSVEDEAGQREVTFQFNQSGKLQYYTNPRGHAVQYFYGTGRERHLVKTIRLPRGTEIAVTYDSNLKLASVAYPGMTNPLSVQVSPNYNTADRYSAAVKHPDFNIETTYQFTEQYNQLAAHAVGQTGVLTTYNADNLPETIVHGEAVYDGNGYLTDINDPVVTQIAYDNWGNVTQLIEALGSAEEIQHTFTYTPLHDIATYTDPRDFTTDFVYSNGNIDYIDDNMNFRTDYTVNNRGLLEIVDNPELISTDYDYDAFGNLTSIQLPLEISQTITYDPVGRPIQVKNPLEQITAYTYDEHNQVEQVIRFGENENISLGYDYDPNDHLINIENAKGKQTVFSYFPDKELLQSVSFGDDATTYTYLDDYRLDHYTKSDGTQMDINYDNQGRIVSDGYVDTYTYDARNNIKTVVKDGLTSSFNYDALDRIDNYTDIYGQVVNYDYDPNGNTTQITYPGGFAVTYEYDANNRLRFTRWDNGAKEVQYTYLKDGRLDRVDYPNGTYCTYGYDAAGRMTEMVTLKSNDTDTICSYTFELDKLGNHLKEHKTEPFGAPMPPMLSAAGTYNDENELQSYNGESFQFDANGNQTGKGGVAATWDDHDMLLSYGTNQYTYDGLGKLRRALRNGQVTRYVWDARGMGNILSETDDNGTPQFYYIHGVGLVARINVQTNAVHYYHYDFRGSTVAMTDASEAITHSYSYLPYGELAQQQEADANPFRFVGKWGVMAEGDDLYYMRARYYDAQTGRFLSEDPVWGDNLYAYSGNNPITFGDFSGESAEALAGSVAAGPTESPLQSKDMTPDVGELCLVNDYSEDGGWGHTWLVYQRNGEVETYGLWMDGAGSGGENVRQDLWKGRENDRNVTASKCEIITQAQEDEFYYLINEGASADYDISTLGLEWQEFQKDPLSVVNKNVCTDFAIDIWNEISQNQISIKGLFRIPGSLQKSN